MEKVMFENICIHVTDMNITPFTVGLLKPKIVLPEVMVDSYSVEELKAIVQHEQTHIRLGHLWFCMGYTEVSFVDQSVPDSFSKTFPGRYGNMDCFRRVL